MVEKQGLGPNQRALVNALRSGKYVQGYLAMKQVCGDGVTSSYCCLGVAADIQEGTTWEKGLSDEVYVVVDPDGNSNGTALTFGLAEKYALYTETGQVTPKASDKNIVSLMYSNDSKRMSFNEIADMLEKHPEWFFTREA